MTELVNKLLVLSFLFPSFPQDSIYFHVFFHSRYSFPFIFWSCPALWISTFPFLKSLFVFSADLDFFFWYILKKSFLIIILQWNIMHQIIAGLFLYLLYATKQINKSDECFGNYYFYTKN